MLFIAPLAAKLRLERGSTEQKDFTGPSLPPEIDFDNPPWEKVIVKTPRSPY